MATPCGRSEPNCLNAAQPRMQISTFFEDIGFRSKSGYLTDILAVREIHDDSFAAHGWHVTHVSLEHARQHPAYADFASMDALYRLSRNKLEYTRICYMRWLAYAQVGADFADLDVINFGFAPSDAAPLRALGTRGLTMLTKSGAMGLAGPGGYDPVSIVDGSCVHGGAAAKSSRSSLRARRTMWFTRSERLRSVAAE